MADFCRSSPAQLSFCLLCSFCFIFALALAAVPLLPIRYRRQTQAQAANLLQTPKRCSSTFLNIVPVPNKVPFLSSRLCFCFRLSIHPSIPLYRYPTNIHSLSPYTFCAAIMHHFNIAHFGSVLLVRFVTSIGLLGLLDLPRPCRYLAIPCSYIHTLARHSTGAQAVSRQETRCMHQCRATVHPDDHHRASNGERHYFLLLIYPSPLDSDSGLFCPLLPTRINQMYNTFNHTRPVTGQTSKQMRSKRRTKSTRTCYLREPILIMNQV